MASGAFPWDAFINGIVGLTGTITNGVQGKKDREQNAENIRQTNETNKEIAEGTNTANQQIADSTNEANRKIAETTNETNRKIAEDNIKYQEEYNKEIWKREDEQAQKEWDFKLSHGINPLADYAVNGMGSGGSTEAPQLNYEQQGYTAQGYNAQGYVVEPYLQESEQLGNTIMMMSGMLDNLETNRKTAEEREGIEEDNEGKKIENEYKEMGLLLDLQEKKGKIQELKDKHRINEAEAKELEKTLDLKIESLKKSLELENAKIKETEANTNLKNASVENTNKSTEKITEDIKTEQKERYLNEIMSNINQDIANEQLDMARQTHEDRVKQEQQNTYFNKLKTDKMRAECVKTWIESGEIISSEARQWLKYNLGKNAVRKNFTEAQLGRLSLLLGL